MVRLHLLQRNKRLLACFIVPMCLFLVILGFRVPDMARQHSSPKPSPRAVIETASKYSKITAAKQVVAVEIFDGTPELLTPVFFPARHLPVTHRMGGAQSPLICARAPPTFGLLIFPG
jgi:hypothetical protein